MLGTGCRIRIEEKHKEMLLDLNAGFFPHAYPAFPIRHALSDELNWRHYCQLMRVETEQACRFYPAVGTANQVFSSASAFFRARIKDGAAAGISIIQASPLSAEVCENILEIFAQEACVWSNKKIRFAHQSGFFVFIYPLITE